MWRVKDSNIMFVYLLHSLLSKRKSFESFYFWLIEWKVCVSIRFYNLTRLANVLQFPCMINWPCQQRIPLHFLFGRKYLSWILSLKCVQPDLCLLGQRLRIYCSAHDFFFFDVTHFTGFRAGISYPRVSKTIFKHRSWKDFNVYHKVNFLTTMSEVDKT